MVVSTTIVFFNSIIQLIIRFQVVGKLKSVTGGWDKSQKSITSIVMHFEQTDEIITLLVV